MQFKFFDKAIVLILITCIMITYTLYYRSVRENSILSANTRKNIFFTTEISDTIKRIEPIYNNDCKTSVWIKNYPADYVVVDLCEQPHLQMIKIGYLIRKEKYTTTCTITDFKGNFTFINLPVEY